MGREPFAFVQPPGGWGSMTDEELAEWVRAQINSAFESMEAEDQAEAEVDSGSAG